MRKGTSPMERVEKAYDTLDKLLRKHFHTNCDTSCELIDDARKLLYESRIRVLEAAIISKKVEIKVFCTENKRMLRVASTTNEPTSYIEEF